MKNPTIWESASRPLFVRSVWLEAAHIGRGQQRHFILDYEPRQQQRRSRLKSAASGTTRKGDNLKHSISCDFSDLDDSQRDFPSNEELFLIGSAKAKYQQQHNSHELKNQPQQKSTRRPSLLAKKQSSYETYQTRRFVDFPELFSRRSSLQDIQSSLLNATTNPDERLAERVLNWLDLAGKSDAILRTYIADKTVMEPVQSKPLKARRSATHTTHSTTMTTAGTPHNQRRLQRAATALQGQRHAGSNRKQSNRDARNTANSSTYACHHKGSEPVKHITIIFNKEGVPVRFNRPARNIDLCSLATSAGTVRRLAGSLASARLYNNAEGSASRQTPPMVNTTRKRSDTMEDTGKYSQHKRYNEENSSSSFHDAKKQLHIFMPSLPKKGLLSSNLSGPDDSSSLLSNTFAELCNI